MDDEYSDDRKISVLVADSATVVGELLSVFLSRDGRFATVAEERSGIHALQKFRKFKPDLVIADLELIEMNGADLIEAIRRESPNVRILVLSGTENRNLLLAAMEARPDGFVHKTESLLTLRDALDAVVRGINYLSPHVVRMLKEARQSVESAARLSHTERNVLQLIAEGNSSQEIAGKLGIGTKTVENHRMQIRNKTGRRDIASLTLHAMRLGMIKLE